MAWAASDIRFEILDDLSDDPVVAVTVVTPEGELRMMAEVEQDGTTLKLLGLHVQGLKPNTVGPGNLRVIAEAVMERMGYDGLEIEGAVRTTGINPGHRPARLRFKRRVRAATVGGAQFV
jgi:hypothetical protein